MTRSVDVILDATGLNRPESVMTLHGRVRGLAPDGLLKVIATDPPTRRDIPKFCVFLGRESVEQQGKMGTYLYWIRKKADWAFRGPRHPTRFSAALP